MSVLTLLASAAALSLDPGLSGAPDAHRAADGAAGYYAVSQARYQHETRTASRSVTRTSARSVSHDGSLSAAAPLTVQLSPGFFHGPLAGGVERPPVQVYWVRHGYVIHGAPHAPVSAGQAAAARGLGQGGTP